MVLLLTLAFKGGSISYPSNYREICISSYVGKLICSILDQTPVLEHVQSRYNLHKSISSK